MPKQTSFSNPFPPREGFQTDARIRLVGLMKAEWEIDVGKDRIKVEYGSEGSFWLTSLFSMSYTITGYDCTLKLKFSKGAFKGQFGDNTQVWYSVDKQSFQADSLLELFNGSFGVGGETYHWRSVPGKSRLQVLTESGKLVLEALKPWQDAELGVIWQIQWIDMPEDFRDRICVLLAPWVGGTVATPSSNGWSIGGS